MIHSARQRLGNLLVLSCLTSFLAMGASAKAQGKLSKKDEASERFQKGVDLYGDGNLRAALIEFRRAYRLVPTFQLLYNLGQVSVELNEYVEAYNYYKLYLRKGKGKIDTARQREVKDELKKLEAFLASITIDVSEDDAEIMIDGVLVGESPMDEEVMVSAGRHQISVTLEDFAPWERTVDLAGRDFEAFAAELVSLKSAPEEDVSNPFLGASSSEGHASYSRAFWTSAAATGLLAVGTGVAALQTLRARDVYNEQFNMVPNQASNIKISAENYRQLALVTDIGIGLTLVGAISTVLLGRKNGQSTQRSAIRMQVGPTQVALLGSF